MASKKFFHTRTNHIYPTLEADNPITPADDLFEFDESDIWNPSSVSSTEAKKMIPSSRSSKKIGRKIDTVPVTTCSSLPVNIPDWSKIYREEYREHQKKDNEDDDDTHFDDEEEDQHSRVPPHEYLARKRGASFSVHEGIGRTLKGRDLRQVRNAIWKRVGFED